MEGEAVTQRRMRRYPLWPLGVMAVVVRAANADKGEAKVDQRVYELRTYHIAPGKAEALHARFRDHTLKVFDKHGMKIEAFWKPLDPMAAEETLVADPRGELTPSQFVERKLLTLLGTGALPVSLVHSDRYTGR